MEVCVLSIEVLCLPAKTEAQLKSMRDSLLYLISQNKSLAPQGLRVDLLNSIFDQEDCEMVKVRIWNTPSDVSRGTMFSLAETIRHMIMHTLADQEADSRLKVEVTVMLLDLEDMIIVGG
jgi:hypothetical protein